MNAAALLPDVSARLAALGVPVLLPADARTPIEHASIDAQGRPKAKGERGLHRYLADLAQQGFVQLWDLQGAYISTVRDIGLLPVTVTAPTAALAEALALSVTRLLHGTAARPTPYTSLGSGQREQLQDGALSIALTFQTNTLIPLGGL